MPPHDQGTTSPASLHGTIAAVCVGLPRVIHTGDHPWMSGIIKQPVDGPVRLGRTNISGDGQADLRVHGGEDKAALVYAVAHYPHWRRELGIEEMTHGGFGENFSVEGLDESNVCLGDIFQVGQARVQVSQPRQPCGNLARRWEVPDLPKRAVQTGRMGWYLRVLQEGDVEQGQSMELLERPLPQWTIAAVNRIFYFDKANQAAVKELARCSLLAECWREVFAQRQRRV